MPLEARLLNVCEFALLGNSKVYFLSLLCSTERMLHSFDVTNYFDEEFASYIEPMSNLAFFGFICYPPFLSTASYVTVSFGSFLLLTRSHKSYHIPRQQFQSVCL